MPVTISSLIGQQKYFILHAPSLIDEIDALVGDTLVSVLRQLRSGYDKRPAQFPQSVILCGVRDIKDCRIHRSDGEIVKGFIVPLSGSGLRIPSVVAKRIGAAASVIGRGQAIVALKEPVKVT